MKEIDVHALHQWGDSPAERVLVGPYELFLGADYNPRMLEPVAKMAALPLHPQHQDTIVVGELQKPGEPTAVIYIVSMGWFLVPFTSADATLTPELFAMIRNMIHVMIDMDKKLKKLKKPMASSQWPRWQKVASLARLLATSPLFSAKGLQIGQKGQGHG